MANINTELYPQFEHTTPAGTVYRIGFNGATYTAYPDHHPEYDLDPSMYSCEDREWLVYILDNCDPALGYWLPE